MDFQVTFKVNDRIYLKDPERSELGRQIVKSSIDLIYRLGFEHFTFKKLAQEIQTTEATIYRYFENKHRMLLYILNWYWSYLEFLMVFQLQNVPDCRSRLNSVIELLTHELPESSGMLDYNKKYLNHIVITESSKVYLVKEVDEINRNEAYKPYKDLCATIAGIISEYNPDYPFPHSLGSTLIETAHFQQFFSSYLPKLTDVALQGDREYTCRFLKNLLFNVIDR